MTMASNRLEGRTALVNYFVDADIRVNCVAPGAIEIERTRWPACEQASES